MRGHSKLELVRVEPEWFSSLYPYFSMVAESPTKDVAFKRTVRGLVRTFDLYRTDFERNKWKHWVQIAFTIKEVEALESLSEILGMDIAKTRFSCRTVRV